MMTRLKTALSVLAAATVLMAGGAAWSQAPAMALPPVVPLAGADAAPAGPSASPPVAEGAGSEYIIGVDDVIDVEIVGQPDRMRAKVYADGTIQANLVGRIPVAGKTPRQAGDTFAARLKEAGYFANPVVNVEVVAFTSRFVTVLGNVVAPGLVPINRSYRLSEILARVGGVREGAAEYMLVRGPDGAEKRYFVRELSIGDPSKDPYVAAGDKIFVPKADVFYISGQVGKPGAYPIREGMTLSEAIALAGGLTESGSGGSANLTRAGKKMKLKQLDKIQANDIIKINERLF